MAQDVAANTNGASPSQIRQRIINALEDERYEWRTIDGLSEQTGIPEAKIQEALASLEQEVVRSSIPDDSGRALYTTRKHYRQTHGVGTRFLNAVSGRVA
jgi:hypothetical protein